MKGMEIEKKFLIKEIPDLSSYRFHTIEQAYLCTTPVVRIRKEDENYYMTYKSTGFLSREEYNLPLTLESYEHLLSKADGNIITKKRYLIPYLSHTIELDIFEGAFKGLVLAEVEFNSIEEAKSFQKPDWFSEDVTYDSKYHNSTMSLTKINSDI